MTILSEFWSNMFLKSPSSIWPPLVKIFKSNHSTSIDTTYWKWSVVSIPESSLQTNGNILQFELTALKLHWNLTQVKRNIELLSFLASEGKSGCVGCSEMFPYMPEIKNTFKSGHTLHLKNVQIVPLISLLWT